MKLRLILLFALSFVIGTAFAAQPAPLQTVKATSQQMLHQLRQYKGRLNNRNVIHRIVRRVVVPKMDVPSIARSVVGRQHWLGASKAQHKQFISLFTSYVIDMYSTALSSYSDETITYQPMRGYRNGQTRVQVYSSVTRPGRSPVSLNYRLVKRSGGWKIYDFSVGGVSMVQSYHAQFADTLNQGGLALLIKQLRSRYKR